MLKIFRNLNKKQTKAVIEDCGADALVRIGKVMSNRHDIQLEGCCSDCQQRMYAEFALSAIPNSKEAIMVNNISGTVTCDERDVYDEAVGESMAVKKAMDNHHRSLLKAVKRWQIAMIKDVIAVSPETFEEAVEKAKKQMKNN